MALPDAINAARALGTELLKIRNEILAMNVDMNDRLTFEHIMELKFGPAKDNNPVRAEGAVTLNPIWPRVVPYPTIQIDPVSGQVFLHDELSPKWFGPLNVPAPARVLGTFKDENDRLEIASAFYSVR